MRIGATSNWGSPIAFCFLIAIVAICVEHYASPPGGLQLPALKEGNGDPTVRMGGLNYPREAIDRDGFKVSIPHTAHRIVSQYWSIDEYVYSIVPPQTVVAVSESVYDRKYSNNYLLAEHFRPVIATDPESVLRLNPDLILVSDEMRPDFTSLMRSAGVPVYRMQTMFQTLKQVETAILLTGYLTGYDEAARREANRFHASIEHARNMAADARLHDVPPPRILGLGNSYSYGSETLFQDIVVTLGGVNVGAEGGLKGYDSISSEQIIRWDPDWIVAGADAGSVQALSQQLLKDPAIALTKAAKNGHVLVLENHVFLPMSPYSTLLVEAMANALYGSRMPGHEA
jgi:iron complex transport system substrate-binding protein